ncbi:MAG: glutaredoxin [Cellulomonas sp.]|nr:glutaredoxin [Cellulomonas sp.]
MVQLDTSPVSVTVVHAEACHFCDEAERELTSLAEQFALAVRLVPLDSVEGWSLVDLHRPAMNPLVLVDGAYFSSGRLPRKKLARLLAARASAAGLDAGRGAASVGR